METKRTILKSQILALTKYGLASFTHLNLRSISEIDIPPITERLDLSNNLCVDFDGMSLPDRTHTLILDHNPILSFRGVIPNTNLKHLSLRNCPISELSSFRILSLLAFGENLETINDSPFSKYERDQAASCLLPGLVDQSLQTQIPENKRVAFAESVAASIRTGVIFITFPRFPVSIEAEHSSIDVIKNRLERITQQINALSDMTVEQLQDPITVRAMRLCHMAKKDENEQRHLIEWIFYPPPPRVGNVHHLDHNEQLEKQQLTILFLQREIEALKKAHDENLSQMRTGEKEQKKRQKKAPVTPETLEAYNRILQESATLLLENSEIVDETEDAQQHKFDYEGLKNAVIRLLDTDPETPDIELAVTLRDLSPQTE